MTTSGESRAPADSKEVRQRLEHALHLDLVGPIPGDALAEERLPGWERPSNRYLTGFLIPTDTPPEKSCDADADDDFELVPENAGLAEESTEDRKAAKKGHFPSSIGLSFLAGKDTKEITVTVRWGDYIQSEMEGADGKALKIWQRQAREKSVLVAPGEDGKLKPVPVPGSGGIQLHIVSRRISNPELSAHIPAGTLSISLFLVNARKPDDENPDTTYAFQAGMEVRSEKPFIPRPNPQGVNAEEWDEEVADLHFADSPEYATGHGISADWEIVDGKCFHLCTAWIPSAEVEKTVTVKWKEGEQRDKVILSMESLGGLSDGASAVTALMPLVPRYRDWIQLETGKAQAGSGKRRETSEELLRLAGVAADRIEKGIRLLGSDPEALEAFRIANRTVARALRKRLSLKEEPEWRVFQLAFILLNLPGMTDSSEPNRETVDLLFFPTGGGKTEAYLGLAAFAMVLRRLRFPGSKGLESAGVCVIMRYTLRLLTLDQLGRAAGLVCALELERSQNPDRLGSWPFEIGLWVGKAATPNILGRRGDGRSDTARTKARQYKANPKGKPSPIPLENCPWCNTRFGSESFALLDDKGNANEDFPTQLKIVCVNFECEFSRDRQLPIVAVDEQLYRRLPAFLISTLDKFASLPWVGQSGALLGGADRFDGAGFYGASEANKGKRLPQPLQPPDLIIQDELHLISGPLGTMAGLYETAIEALCLREVSGRTIRPKIVASTATVRRAQDQIQALFARPLTQIFPPPGPDRRDSFFARVQSSKETPARRYLGVSAQGRNPKVVLRKVWLALMGAGERSYRDDGGHKNPDNFADPYMTVLGYFNSLRELGGARRILEEEVQNTLKSYGSRKRVGEERGLFQDRKTFSEVVELTSRVSTDKVAEARRRLESGFHEPHRVDCAIATNMISVGLDIPRLGLMVVFGQPKTNAEYIQATSRVGRDDKKPGLVIALLNIHKPRDRSHYERFRHYHETFYRAVEVSSVTPFSARALDRGFAGAFMGLSRHMLPELTPPRGVENLAKVRSVLEARLLETFLGRVRRQPIEDDAELEERLRSVQNRVVDLLDSWRRILDDYKKSNVDMQYQKYELDQPKPLLREMLDREFESSHHRKFRANRSLRDVEPSVNLYLRDLSGLEVEEG